MRSAEAWLDEYALTHQNPVNQRIHTVAVPLIFWSIIAFLATFPPLTLLVLMPALTFYFALGMLYGVVMAMLMGFSLMFAYLLMIWGLPVRYIAIGVFVLAWIAQFYGHKVEGKKPAFLTDIVFLLVGPLWTLKKLRLLK
jgi:uncharacterized membrane protein YGL010W